MTPLISERGSGASLSLTILLVLSGALAALMGVAGAGAETGTDLAAVQARHAGAQLAASVAAEKSDLLDDDGALLDEDGEELLDEDEVTGEQDLETDELLDEDREGKPAEAEHEEVEEEDVAREAERAHEELFLESRFPSANTCRVCHPKQYEEWSVSQHAYAQLSPVYMAMQRTFNATGSSTTGDFCVRCHTQVGMILGESPFISNLERHPTSREGITCVVCHRLNREYGKISGRLGLVEGDLLQPVYGPQGNAELKRVLENRHEYQVVTEPDAPGRKIHTDVVRFPQISHSGFCGICHDVNQLDGFRLEEAFSDYKSAPAAKAGISCQDCHMGKVQGVSSGYEHGPAAMVGGVPTKPRKLTNHFFAGPDYSVVHPGIFPHNAEAAELATLEEWLEFDHQAGWGTDEFEDNVPEDYQFPDRWQSIDDRYDAREIIDKQRERLAWAREKRIEVLRNGYQLGEIVTVKAGRSGVHFKVEVKNATSGHNVPTGFVGERVTWLEITITDPAGEVVFRSGDLDPNGDLRDSHSLYVHNGELPLDDQLFNLKSKFLVRNLRGGERDQVLPSNSSLDVLPFVRPSTNSTVLTGQPVQARVHRQGIPPLSSRWANYKVEGTALTGPGTYSGTVRLKSAMVPVNLISAIKDVGFDYGMSAREVGDRVVAGHVVLWERTVTIEVR
jgi:nitrate/TMAO reductase-like tetraheme cytochrome c subunit